MLRRRIATILLIWGIAAVAAWSIAALLTEITVSYTAAEVMKVPSILLAVSIVAAAVLLIYTVMEDREG